MNSQKDITRQRLEEKLERECGTVIVGALRDPSVIEILLNPDGKVWLDVAGKGMEFSGHVMHPSAAESVLTTCASMLQTSITREPQAIRPATDAAHARTVHIHQVEAIRHAVRERHNILIVGGTGSGKTTLANAILAEIATLCVDDRLVAIEDTMELQVTMPNSVLLRTSEHANMQRLLRATMRLRPDRIVVGEVRGGEALTLLKSWNTGHPGGIATIHANSAEGGVVRLSQLIYEAAEARNLSETTVAETIRQAVNLVMFIERSASPAGRSLSQIMEISDYVDGRFLMRPVQIGPQPLVKAV